MKKKLLILFLSIISAVCLAFGLSACSEKEVYSTLEMEEGIIYFTDFSVQYTSETESPDGNIDENSLADEKSGSVQNYFMVMSFDMQTASDIINTEYLTVTLTVLDADVVNTTIDYTNTSATEEKTTNGQTIITATYSLPDKAQLVKSIQLVVELKPNNIGATDIAYEFSSDSKSVTGYNNEDCTFKLSSNSVKISQTSLEYALSGDGKSYTVTGIGTKSGLTYIRDTYNGLPVTAIGNKAFYNCSSLTSITIPDSVTSIGDSAFYKCTAITSITIPDSVKSIGSAAFYNCASLTSVNIGNGVTSIGDSAFGGCSSLTSITIPKRITTIGSSAFRSCSKLTSVYYSGTASQWASISFDNVTANPLCYAGNLYLNNMLATNITLEGITTINDYVFYGYTALESITIGSGVTYIGNDAFYNCISLASITIPDSVTSIGGSTFYGCTSLTSITIPDGVTSIGGSTFRGCTSLTSITIPDGVTSIGSYAFYNCTAEIIWGDSPTITTINSYAFAYYMGTSVTIPDSVTSIDTYAFKNCSSLTSIIIPDNVISIGSSAFGGCSSLVNITIPFVGSSASATSASSSTLFGYVFGTSSYDGGTSTKQYYASGSYVTYYIPTTLTTVTITSGSIYYGAFYNCSSLTSVTLPSSITSIDDYAFNRCSGLTSISIPDSVTSIGDYTFKGCTSLTYNEYENGYYLGNDNNKYLVLFQVIDTTATSFTINQNTKFIDTAAFYGCTALTSITIPDSVTSIGDSAFNGCTALESVTIGSGVTSIGSYAFWYCISLAKAIFKDTTTWYFTYNGEHEISSSSLSNTYTAAMYLIGTYSSYYWHKN